MPQAWHGILLAMGSLLWTLAYKLWPSLQSLNLGDWHVCMHCRHGGFTAVGAGLAVPLGIICRVMRGVSIHTQMGFQGGKVATWASTEVPQEMRERITRDPYPHFQGWVGRQEWRRDLKKHPPFTATFHIKR